MFPVTQRVEVREQRGERRLVHVADRGVGARGEEVQLVADVPVAGAECHLDAERGGGDQPHRLVPARMRRMTACGAAAGAGRVTMVVLHASHRRRRPFLARRPPDEPRSPACG